MNTINLLLLASSGLALLFAYIPGFKTYYEPLDPTRKRLIMAGLLLVVTIGVYAYGCARPGLTDFTCNADTAWNLAANFVLAIMANQTTHDLLGKIGKGS